MGKSRIRDKHPGSATLSSTLVNYDTSTQFFVLITNILVPTKVVSQDFGTLVDSVVDLDS
jgi:hypothetical protein